MTLLHDLIRTEIETSGPITVGRYMQLCLSHPEHGYYVKGDPLGREGDFTTAPEISQLFGELIGAWLVEAWRQLGRPAPCALVELGPGRGTLMADILRIVSLEPALRDALDTHLVETSPALRAAQITTLLLLASRRPTMAAWNRCLTCRHSGWPMSFSMRYRPINGFAPRKAGTPARLASTTRATWSSASIRHPYQR